MDLHDWVEARGGIAHRRAAEEAGFRVAAHRSAVRDGAVRRVRRQWLATESAPADLLVAADAGGRLACVSVARRKGWWIPEDVDDAVHVRVEPNGRAPSGDELKVHWTKQIAPPPGYGLLESIEDALAHVAECLPPQAARVVWESAIISEGLAVEALRNVRWRSQAARACAAAAAGLSDSGIETIFVSRLSGWGVPIVQQAVVAGHYVDVLIGERLVVQIDGFAHHSSSAQRSRDIALDAELALRGYTVLRFSYAQIVHRWPEVERAVARAIAAGAHRAV